MKRLILALSITLLATQAIGADLRWNVPLPRPAPEKMLDPAVPHAELTRVAALHVAQTNPDPFRTQTVPVQQSSPPAPGQPVIVATPAPVIDTTPGLLSWVLTAIGGTGVGGLLLNIFRKPKGVDPGAIVQNPDFQNVLDQAVSRALNSDPLRGAVRSGLSLIPGVGPFANTIEEVANRAAKMAVAQARGVDPVFAPNPPNQSGAAEFNLEAWKTQLLQDVGNVVQTRIEAALKARAT